MANEGRTPTDEFFESLEQEPPYGFHTLEPDPSDASESLGFEPPDCADDARDMLDIGTNPTKDERRAACATVVDMLVEADCVAVVIDQDVVPYTLVDVFSEFCRANGIYPLRVDPTADDGDAPRDVITFTETFVELEHPDAGDPRTGPDDVPWEADY